MCKYQGESSCLRRGVVRGVRSLRVPLAGRLELILPLPPSTLLSRSQEHTDSKISGQANPPRALLCALLLPRNLEIPGSEPSTKWAELCSVPAESGGVRRTQGASTAVTSRSTRRERDSLVTCLLLYKWEQLLQAARGGGEDTQLLPQSRPWCPSGQCVTSTSCWSQRRQDQAPSQLMFKQVTLSRGVWSLISC